MTENQELISSAKMELRNLEGELIEDKAGRIYLCPKARHRRNIIQGLIDALETSPEAMKWRPMSEAKDGTLIVATDYEDNGSKDPEWCYEVGFAQDLKDYYEIWIPVPKKQQPSKEEKLACKIANELMNHWGVNEWNAPNAAEAVIKLLKE